MATASSPLLDASLVPAELRSTSAPTITARLDNACPADPSHVVRVGDRLWFVPDVGFVCASCRRELAATT